MARNFLSLSNLIFFGLFFTFSCDGNVSVPENTILEEISPESESENANTADEKSTYSRIDISADSKPFYDREIVIDPIKVLVSFFPHEASEESAMKSGTIRYQILFEGNKYIDSDTQFAVSSGSVYLQNLDDDGIPEVITETYTGGAHCCTELTIYSWQGDGFIESFLVLDGSAELFRDLDQDGNSDFLMSNQSFLYKFSSYAGSFPPTLVLSFEDGEFKDTTRDHIPELRLIEERMYQAFFENQDDGEVNGILAGYVAQKALLGEYEDGWNFMLEHYDRNSDWGLEKERSESGEVTEQYPDFPSALEAFLKEQGYLDNLK